MRFYCCGPTVYGPAHIGNFRTFIMQDVFRRVLEATGMKTRHVRNLTDVDDKTIRQSQAEGRSLGEFTQHWTDRFHEDCDALNLMPPHVEPSAVAHIPEQIELIQKLVDGGNAYKTDDGSVYFSVNSFPDYGNLSRLAERSITTTETDRESSDEYERDSAADFALWKAQRDEDGPNHWPSPWSKGRPGWHIECSCMVLKHLGESFDVHSGGVDLIFPHHENEIAQSEAATGKPFVQHWFHIAHLMVEGKKMSKSLKNLYTLQDIAERGFNAVELRYVLLSGSYRQPLNFTFDSLQAARSALKRLGELQEKLGGAPDPIPPEQDFGPFQPVLDALLNDLNTPDALGRLFRIAREIQKALDAGELNDDQCESAQLGLAMVLQALGLVLPSADGEVLIPEEIQTLADERWEARKQRDWDRADSLRDKITKAGWQVEDRKETFDLTPLN